MDLARNWYRLEPRLLAVSQLQGSTVAIISANVPGPHVGECGPGPESKFSKIVEVGWMR